MPPAVPSHTVGQLFDQGVIGKRLVNQNPDWCKVAGLTWYTPPRLEKNSDSEKAAIAMRLGAGCEQAAVYPALKIWDVDWNTQAMSFHTWITHFYGRRDVPSMKERYMIAKMRVDRGQRASQDLIVQGFLKDERYTGKNFKVKPRLVMQVSDLRQQVFIAPAVASASKAIHIHCRDVDESIVYDSGFTAQETGAWAQRMMSRFDFCIENDFAEYESRVTVQALQANHEYYCSIGMPKQALDQFRTYYNPIFYIAGQKFRRWGSRCSGVADTSLGNSHANALAHVGAFTALGFLKGVDYAIIVKGDDSLIFCTEAVANCKDQIEAYMSALGLSSKITVRSKAAGEFPLIEFCSCRFISSVDGGLTMVTKFGKFLANGIHCPHDSDWLKYVAPMMLQFYRFSPSSLTSWFAWKWIQHNLIEDLPEPVIIPGHLEPYRVSVESFKSSLGEPTGPIWRVPDNYVTRAVVQCDCPIPDDYPGNSFRPPVLFSAPVNSKSQIGFNAAKFAEILTRDFHRERLDRHPDVLHIGYEYSPDS